MKSLKQMSKLIALVLRHKPEQLGLTMDAHGWVSTEALIAKLNAIQPFTRKTRMPDRICQATTWYDKNKKEVRPCPK